MKTKLVLFRLSAQARGFVEALVRPKLEQHFDFIVSEKGDKGTPTLDQKCEYVMCVQHASKQEICELIQHAKQQEAKCVWVHALMAGVDPLQSSEVRDLGVPVTNAKGVFSWSLGEWIIMAALHFEKQIDRLNQNKKDHKWDRYQMGELRGKTLGILGYGDIGRACTKLAIPFGMQVVGVKRRLGDKQPGDKDDLGAQVFGMDHRDELFRSSDYLVTILPGTEENFHSVTKKDLALMKNTAVFMNIGRGMTVNEMDVVEALKSGTIRGAALDVHEQEPLPEDSAIWDAPNLLLSPHNADLTEDYHRSTVERFLELATNHHLKQTPFPNLVDLSLGY
eukprot:TRINITY_DN3764_c0_g1_i1.p1 TRINITY_DN3764_c0_g1~~TRINITY_DN3764_c0_g1_i1.p1  ORF type:complete len:336 (+),score=25.32 TRINITY_DN3764_c0_g1_i1:43-1050(+)